MKKVSWFLLIMFSTFGTGYEHKLIEFIEPNQIVIEDGSSWTIEGAFSWEEFKGAPLSFRADESWLNSEAKCSFVNKNTGAVIYVKLASVPTSYEDKTHWVAYLEPTTSFLFLDNGVKFLLYENDKEYFSNWRADDFVIIGDYTSWLSQNKHILFNYRTKEFIFGEELH
jgi:hypothetical protein